LVDGGPVGVANAWRGCEPLRLLSELRVSANQGAAHDIVTDEFLQVVERVRNLEHASHVRGGVRDRRRTGL
jgi:hypothetical protein